MNIQLTDNLQNLDQICENYHCKAFLLIFSYIILMKKNSTIKSLDLAASSQDYAFALQSLRNLMPQRASTSDSQQNIEQKSGKRLVEIFRKTKRERMRDIFIKKLKRSLQTNKLFQLKGKRAIKGPCGVLVEAIQFPQYLAHVVVITNVIVVLILVFLATLEGFIDNFVQQCNHTLILALKVVCLIINMSNFFLKCTNKSFGNGENLTYIHEVLKAYALSGRLFLDFLTISFQIATLASSNMTISGVFFFLLILVLIFTVSDLIQIQTAVLHSEKSLLIWGVIKVCLSNIIFAHFMASFVLAMSRIDLQRNWMTKISINQESWDVKYSYAFYWGTTIMMTVGFGDVLPGNPKEVIITSFLQMFSCILLGYNISQIGHLIGQLRQKNEATNRKIAVFDRMVKTMKMHIKNSAQSQKEDKERLSKLHRLSKDIYNHIKQLNNGQGNLVHEQQIQLLAELPQHLRKAYYHQANQKIFPSVLFFNRLKPSTVESMSQKFSSKFYYSGEKLIQSQQRIMILQEGQIGFIYTKRGSLLNGQSFDQILVKEGGETQLLTSNFLSLFRDSNYNLRANQSSIVWSISQQDFLNSLSSSQIDNQYYFSILHKHPIDQEEWNCVVCPRCSQKDNKVYHVIYNCPRITHRPFRQIIAMKFVQASDPNTCFRAKNNTKRNKSSKTSVLKNKRIFQKVMSKLNNYKKNIVHLFDNFANDSLNQSIAEQSLLFHNDLGRKNFLQKQVSDLNVERFSGVLESTIRKYETGYEDDFWDLQSDSICNYQFYFPNINANRLISRDVDFYSTKPNKIIRKNNAFYSTKHELQEQISVIIENQRD